MNLENMTTDENILKEMLERVTNPAKEPVDNLAVQMFCMLVQSNSSLVSKAHDLIVEKMHSNNTTEAARAIGLLEECMSKGGAEFQNKTAKFTFLNALMALVLDRHSGMPAPVETKKRIMDCLMLWTVEHQDKTKIQQAYDNLQKQVNFSHGPSNFNTTSPAITNVVREQRYNILGKDDELVAKLLKQGGEENYKKANLLIQHRVNQEARRTEFTCHLKSELKKIESTMELLDEMLNSCISDTPGIDSRDIMQELYNACKGHNEQMARWPDFLGDTEPEFLEDVLNTKDLLMIVIYRYKELFEKDTHDIKPTDAVVSKTVSPNIKSSTENITTNTDLLSEFLTDTKLNPASTQEINTKISSNSSNKNNAIDELNEIFGNISGSTKNNKPQHPSDLLLGSLDLLEPISVFENANKTCSAETNNTLTPSLTKGKEIRKTQGFKELKEIDKLSEEIFKKSLKDEQRLATFKKETEKLTLNDLAKDKIQTSLHQPENISESKNQTLFISNCLETKSSCSKSELIEDTKKYIKEQDIIIDDKNILDSTPEKNVEIVKRYSENEMTDSSVPAILPLKPLAEINIELDDLIPLDEGQRLLLDDDDIRVTLNFTADRPSEHVSVIVMAVTNKSKLPIKDFQFEASVKKPCKIRLLPPTDVCMAPSKPFRPAAPINQILLLLNPTQKQVDITCIVGYKLGDDPDPIKESIVAKDIPYV